MEIRTEKKRNKIISQLLSTMAETTEDSHSRIPKELVFQDVLDQVQVLQENPGKGHQLTLVPQVVGDYGRWQLKVVLLLWIPMFFCGTQFVTTDYMNMQVFLGNQTRSSAVLVFQPKVLHCKDTWKDTCDSYDTVFPSHPRCPCHIIENRDRCNASM